MGVRLFADHRSTGYRMSGRSVLLQIACQDGRCWFHHQLFYRFDFGLTRYLSCSHRMVAEAGDKRSDSCLLSHQLSLSFPPILSTPKPKADFTPKSTSSMSEGYPLGDSQSLRRQSDPLLVAKPMTRESKLPRAGMLLTPKRLAGCSNVEPHREGLAPRVLSGRDGRSPTDMYSGRCKTWQILCVRQFYLTSVHGMSLDSDEIDSIRLFPWRALRMSFLALQILLSKEPSL